MCVCVFEEMTITELNLVVASKLCVLKVKWKATKNEKKNGPESEYNKYTICEMMRTRALVLILYTTLVYKCT